MEVAAPHIQTQNDGIIVNSTNTTSSYTRSFNEIESTSSPLQLSPKGGIQTSDGAFDVVRTNSNWLASMKTGDDYLEKFDRYATKTEARDTSEINEKDFGYRAPAMSTIGMQRATNFRSKFRKSHTCGSLFAKCSCSPPSPASVSLQFPIASLADTDTSVDTQPSSKLYQSFSQSTSSTASTPNTNTSTTGLSPENSVDGEQRVRVDIGSSATISDNQPVLDERAATVNCSAPNKTQRKPKRLFQSYSHPDTNFVFTDENKNPTKDRLGARCSVAQTITTRSGKVEIKHPKRSSSPNIGQFTVLDVAVHPEILVKISPKHSAKPEHNDLKNILSRSLTTQNLHERRRLLKRSDEVESGSTSDSETSTDLRDIKQTLSKSSANSTKLVEDFNAAQKYFQESGILGPFAATPTNLIRKTSKILQDANVIEQIRKSSLIIRNSSRASTASTPVSQKGNEEADVESEVSSPKTPPQLQANPEGEFKATTMDDRDKRIKALHDEIVSLKDILKCRDSEIIKLQREIHKLKSVLQQTTNHTHLQNDDFLQTLQSTSCMAGQQCSEVSSSISYLLPCYITNGGSSITTSQTATAACALSAECDDKIDSKVSTKGHHILTAPVLKKQGVSGESCDSSSIHQSINVPIPKFVKDFRSKQLIKEAIMDNDFLKNIDSSQVRELVESMYSLDVAKGEYVIREGEAGAHLYVSAEGEFEVVKANKVLGVMGPGKAFGELAILYNCTRTASIRVLSNAKVWVLDRRVFQQIMMRTGMQRIENSVNFLKSVPLLKNLSFDVLSKIADVLEVEFYPAGTYIIRQGASGDTFFLISQGCVQVTQKVGSSSEEKQIRQLQRGDYFGEQALINEDKRTANIIALEPGVECLTLDRESFTHLIGDLCELKEKNYGDENRFLAMKSDQTKETFGADVKQEFPEMKLSDLEVVTTLGIGGFGRVVLVKAYRDNTVDTFALKCLKKKHVLDTRQQEHVFSERTIMLACNTPFICRLYRTFRDNKYMYMLMEACMGGEVWTMLRDRGSFDENATQFIIGCVLQAFEYLHARGIIYRDLKPENLMLDEKGYVKLVDFGFAKYIGNSNKTWTFCGTPEYVAPEIILNKGHDRAVDYWALGILIHELLNGTPPFTANDPMKTYNIILKGIDMIDFPKHMSRSAIQLIKKLCRDVPAERLGYQKGGIQDIKKQKWFLGFDWDGLASQLLIPPFVRPVCHPTDTCYFDKFPTDPDVPPDDTSGWDDGF